MHFIKWQKAPWEYGALPYDIDKLTVGSMVFVRRTTISSKIEVCTSLIVQITREEFEDGTKICVYADSINLASGKLEAYHYGRSSLGRIWMIP